MNETTTGATHSYGPIGAALGSFAGFVDVETLSAIRDGLRDAAAQEFTWMSEAQSDAERAYHRARWQEQHAAADYAELMAPIV